jgi:membrane protein DedA with SNARE-associated domain
VSDAALDLVSAYGAPALFAILVAAAAGVPLPATLLLLLAGSLVSSGDLDLWLVLLLATLGVLLGDQVGYLLGRLGGEEILRRVTELTHGEDQAERARHFVGRWGAVAVFLSRWLVGPLGPWVNVTTGSAHYSWVRFTSWAVLGELIWVGLYVGLGHVFGDRIEALAGLAGSLGLTLASLVLLAGLGWLLVHHLRKEDPAPGPA